MMSNETELMGIDALVAAFQDVGVKQYGYEYVTAEFSVFKDFKVQWSRSLRVIRFKVSDYLEDAPYAVFESLAQTLFARIQGKEEVPYKRAMREWVLSPKFSESKRFRYINRSSTITGSTRGYERDLKDSIDRLVEMGLIDRDSGIAVSWSLDGDSPRAASCSVLFKLIVVSRQLDDLNIPDFVVDYAVYSQYLRIVKGAEVFGFTTEVCSRDEEKRFEKYYEAERLLDKMSLYL